MGNSQRYLIIWLWIAINLFKSLFLYFRARLFFIVTNPIIAFCCDDFVAEVVIDLLLFLLGLDLVFQTVCTGCLNLRVCTLIRWPASLITGWFNFETSLTSSFQITIFSPSNFASFNFNSKFPALNSDSNFKSFFLTNQILFHPLLQVQRHFQVTKAVNLLGLTCFLGPVDFMIKWQDF